MAVGSYRSGLCLGQCGSMKCQKRAMFGTVWQYVVPGADSCRSCLVILHISFYEDRGPHDGLQASDRPGTGGPELIIIMLRIASSRPRQG